MQEWKYLHLVHICVYEHMLIYVYCLDFCIIYKGMRVCVLCVLFVGVHAVFERVHGFVRICVWLCTVDVCVNT